MNERQFLLLMDELLELSPGTVKPSDVLADLEGWDSLAVIGFLALADEHFGVRFPPQKLSECKMVSDLMKLTADRAAEGHYS